MEPQHLARRRSPPNRLLGASCEVTKPPPLVWRAALPALFQLAQCRDLLLRRADLELLHLLLQAESRGLDLQVQDLSNELGALRGDVEEVILGVRRQGRQGRTIIFLLLEKRCRRRIAHGGETKQPPRQARRSRQQLGDFRVQISILASLKKNFRVAINRDVLQGP